MQWPLFRLPSTLRKAGVLGINRRNIQLVQRLNSRTDYPKADDKYLTKTLAQKFGIPTPHLLDRVESVGAIRSCLSRLKELDEFVIKPAHGSGGEGIVVVTGKNSEREFLRARGDTITLSEIRYHLASILHGLYSLGGTTDQVLIEERVHFDPIFRDISVRGVPDIRIVVVQGVPILAMLRLPTVASGGRANLHQGAVAAGVDIVTGKTCHGVWQSRSVTTHPDTGADISGRTIPCWEDLLRIAALGYEMTNLGYLGVDIVFDEKQGPLLLEVNVRPGLAIQLANQIGLLNRVKALLAVLPKEGLALEDRLALSKELFSPTKKL